MAPVIDVLLSHELAEAPQRAAALDEAGAAGLFTYEGTGDVFFPLARAADHTSGLLYTNIAVAFPRSPMHLAYAAWDLQGLSGGRFVLGLGSQIRAHIERRFGSTWDSPLGQMQEWIAALRAIFASWQHGAPLDFEGRWTTHTLSSPTLTPAPLDTAPPPIWLAALGPRMTRLAGSDADGLLVHPFTSSAHVAAHTMPNLEAGLASAGRSRADVIAVIGSIVGLHDGTDERRAKADAMVRTMLGFYGSTPAYRPVLDTHGWGDLQPELRAMTKAGDWGELGSKFSAEQVATLSVVGTPDEVGAALATRFGDHADRVALSLPQGVDPDELRSVVSAFEAAVSRD